MATKKGKGRSKRKGPAKTQPQSVQRPSNGMASGSDDEETSAAQQSMLDQLAVLEWARGLSPGGPLMEVPGSATGMTARQCYNAEMFNCLSFFGYAAPSVSWS